MGDVLIHKPRVNDKVIAAAISKHDRSRYVVRVPGAMIVDVDPASMATRVLAPRGEWEAAVRAVDRRVGRALAAWTERHNIVDGALMPSICPAGGSVYFTLKNQPDTGRESVSTVCDITAELSDIKRGSKDDRYRLVWRVMEAEFRESAAVADDGDDEGDDEGDAEDAGGDDAEDAVASLGADKDASLGATMSTGDALGSPGVPAGVEGLDHSLCLSDISAQLQSIAEKVRALETRQSSATRRSG